MTAPRLRQVYDEVHFPLMVPHKVARYSELSSAGGRARASSRSRTSTRSRSRSRSGRPTSTGRSRRAPGSPRRSSRTRPSRSSTSGQKYQVYTTGGAVQRIALVTPQATYWVSNTILNELSNSTMLAIAESLRPLRR